MVLYSQLLIYQNSCNTTSLEYIRDINTEKKKREQTQKAFRNAKQQLERYTDTTAFKRTVKKVAVIVSAREVLNNDRRDYSSQPEHRQTEDKIFLDRLRPKFIAHVSLKVYPIVYKFKSTLIRNIDT